MCGCNKNRGLRSPASQVNPVYKPNTWNHPQKAVIPAPKSVQIQTINKQITPPVQAPAQIQATKHIAVNASPAIQPVVNNPAIKTNGISVANPLPVHNQVKNTVQIPLRTPITPVRSPYIPRVPVKAPIKAPIKAPTNAPARTPYVPNQNKPVAPVLNIQNVPKPVTNTTITRNVRLSIPAQPASIPKPTNMQPSPQTLLANRISAANRKR